jgi:hypothetical protein
LALGDIGLGQLGLGNAVTGAKKRLLIARSILRIDFALIIGSLI